MPEYTKAQQNAIQLRNRNLLVSAAAGAGKTTTMTERIIRSLIGDDTTPGKDISRMLIVTFTRAAAADIRSKIATALTEAIAANPGNTHLTKQLLQLGDAHIGTIDSFYLEPVREHFAELGLPPQFRMADQVELNQITRDILGDVMNDFFKRCSDGTAAAPSAPLREMRQNSFAELLNRFSPDRDPDRKLEDTLLHLYDKLIQTPDGIGFLNKYADQLIDEASSASDFFHTPHGHPFLDLVKSDLEEFYAYCQEKADDLDPHADNYPYKDHYETVMALLDSQVFPLLNEPDSYENFVQRVLNLDFGKFTKVPDPVRFKQLRDEFGKKKADLLKNWVDYIKIWHPEQLKAELEQTASDCRLLADFLNEFDKRFLEQKKRRGICDFSDPPRFLLELLRSPDGLPTPLAAGIAGQFDEVCVDEYQDVNEMQDMIFSLIGGDHRFLVGDIKQSIYAFRGADPSVFARYRKDFDVIPNRDLTKQEKEETFASQGTILMSENFRCDETVVDFTNLICKKTFSACSGSPAYDELVFYKNHNSEKKNITETPCPVQVVLFEKQSKKGKSSAAYEETDAETREDLSADSSDFDDINPEERGREIDLSDEVTWITDEIVRLLGTEVKNDGSPILPGDIAVIVRKNNLISEFRKALESVGVPCVCEKEQSIAKDPDLILLLSLLEVIDNPQKDIPLETVLTSDIVGLSLRDLVAIRKSGDNDLSLCESIRAFAETDMSEADEEKKKLAEIIRRFFDWLSRWQRDAITESAERVIRLLWRDERLAAHVDSQAAFLLYDYARTYQGPSYNSLYSFIRFFVKAREKGELKQFQTGDAKGAVSLITVHASKGLEFPVCFISRLGTPFSQKEAKNDLIHHAGFGIAMKKFDPSSGNKLDPPLRKSALEFIRKKNLEEEIRILYVALTRAKERLYVTATLPRASVTIESEMNKAARCAYVQNAVLNATSALDWILAALASDTNGDHEKTYRIIRGEKKDPVPFIPVPTKNGDTVNTPMTVYKDVLKEQNHFVYPNEDIRRIPGKITASAASPTWLDERDKERNDLSLTQEADRKDELNKWERNVNDIFNAGAVSGHASSAERGTAFHAFLQFCNWHLIAEYGVIHEAERLVKEGFIDRSALELIPEKDLKALENSELMDLVIGSVRQEREFRFSRILPLTDFTTSDKLRNRYKDETVFLQGSLDLLLEMPGGDLVLCDYKTDRIRTERNESEEQYADRMRDVHGMQLKLYADAVEVIFGKRPVKCYIYSIPTQKLILL